MEKNKNRKFPIFNVHGNLNNVAIALGKLGYASYRGKVYKKNDQARYTYSDKCEARAFVNTLATNEFFKAKTSS